MKILNLIQELEATKAFQEFKKENPDSFLSAGFFVLDDTGEDKFQLDYFIPSKNQVAIAPYPFSKLEIQKDEIKQANRLQKVKIDITDLRETTNIIIQEKNIRVKISKIVAILLNDTWDLTCMSSTLDVIKIKLNSLTGEVLKCEKLNLGDFMQIRKK